jgi:hypothetical protein
MARAAVWVGGSTGSGKSTVTRLLAARLGLRVFPIDAFWYSHVHRLGELDDEPTPDAQWLGMTPAEQAADFEALTRRRWPLVAEDLAGLPAQPPVIVEGPQVLPDLIPAGDRVVFLIGTPEWQRSVLEKRPLPVTADPARALENRIEKDRLFGERIGVLARSRGFPVIPVDGRRSPEEIAGQIRGQIGEGLPEKPGSEPVSGVPAARRWENRVVAENIRSWMVSSHWTSSGPQAWPFACECGRPACVETVPCSMEEFDRSPRVLAAGH